MRVWVLHLNGAFSICENFRQVMRSVIVRLIPNGGEQSRLRLMDQYPDLAAIGAQGSFYQLVRYLNARQHHAEIIIEEHNVDHSPEEPSLFRAFDFNGLDPSFDIQACLWDLAGGIGTGSIDDRAEALEREIEAKLEALRIGGATQSDVLADLREREARFDGLKVIPAVGSADAVLAKLPKVAANVFREAAHEAFGYRGPEQR